MNTQQVKSFFEAHHLRACEMNSVLGRMEGGLSFSEAMRQEEADWTDAESGSTESVELEAFRYTVFNSIES